MFQINNGKEDDYLQMLNANYLKKFSKNYLNKLQVYLDDEVYKTKAEDLPQLKSITILKFEKMIKKENMMKEKKKFNNLNKISSGNLPDETNKIKINIKENQRGESPSSANRKNIKKHRNFYRVRYIILDTGNKMMDIQNMDEDFSKSDLYDPFKTYLQEENEKLRKQALDKIVSSAINSTNFVKPNSIGKRLKKETNSKNSKSNLNSVLNQSQINEANTNNENNNLNEIVLSRDKEAIDMYSTHFSKKKTSQSNFNEWSNKCQNEDNEENFENFMKFFKEACEINNYITIDQKIDYFMHIKNNIFLNKSKSDRRNMIPFTLTNRRKAQTGDQEISSTHAEINTGGFNNLNLKMEQEFHTFYEHHAEEIRKSLTVSESSLPVRKRNTHKATISFNIHHKYISDLKNKFKLPEEINYKMQVDLENFYTDLLSKIKLSKKQGNNIISTIKDNYATGTNAFEKIKHFLNIKEISLDKVILRECEISNERFLYMLGKKAFDFRILQHINFSRNLLGDIGASYLLHLIKMNSTRLEYLDLSYNKIGKTSCEYLSSILSDDKVELISLNLSGNLIGDKNFSEISVGISKNTSLNKLGLAANDLGKISSVILGTILRYDKKLKFLDVSKNYFNDDVIKNLLKGLISNSCLETLILNENNLTNSSLKNFETTLSVNYTLKEIFLDRNLFTNNSSLKFLSILFKNLHIDYLSLIGNKLDAHFAETIIENEKKMPVKVINKSDYLGIKMKNDDQINFHEMY